MDGSIHVEFTFRLTEWAEDGSTRKRYMRIESTCMTDAYTELTAKGEALTADELVIVSKMVAAMKEMEDLNRARGN